jgi:hypothetical protein
MFDLPSECKEIRFGEACGEIKHPKVHDEENLLICIVLDVTTFVLLASSEGEFLYVFDNSILLLLKFFVKKMW